MMLFCLGYLAGLCTLVLAMVVGERFRQRDEYYPEVPLTRDELAARREKLTSSLIEASYRRAQ